LLQGIAALIAAIGAIAVFFLKVMLDRQDERRRRQERVDDLVHAVKADIAVERERLSAVFSPERSIAVKTALLENIEAGRPKPMPRTTTGVPSLVLDSLKREISLLPSAVIEPVIRFYRLNQGIDALDEAFASGVFDDIDPDRQRAALDSYFLSGSTALEAANQALQALSRVQADVLPDDSVRRGSQER
jgi:hypothetical protein